MGKYTITYYTNTGHREEKEVVAIDILDALEKAVEANIKIRFIVKIVLKE